jgi:aryl-alcohol dehydrogenase-like predicted oxidoreductase
MKSRSNKITLGTAKLGIDGYGFSSDNLKRDKAKFLKESYDIGINSLDTSPRYGNAEKIIGEFYKEINDKPLINSKIDGLQNNNNLSPKLMVESVKRSIDRMKIAKLNVCYLHQNEIEIISDPYVQEGFKILKEMNLIDYCGTSIYSFSELDYTISSLEYDFIQAPVNVLDTSYYDRIIQSKSNIKICARSLYLQGILIQDKLIPKKIKNHKILLKTLYQLKDLCKDYDVDLSTVCIAYVNSLKKIDQVIIGTSSKNNLRAIIGNSDYELDKNLIKIITKIAAKPKTWTNPKNWNIQNTI